MPEAVNVAETEVFPFAKAFEPERGLSRGVVIFSDFFLDRNRKM
jgi:hypothetical protein